MDWIDAYKELSERIDFGMPKVTLIDLWREQPYFQEKEYPLGDRSVFLEFGTDKIDTVGGGTTQDMDFTVRVYYLHKTLADTHRGASTQVRGLEFAQELRKIHKLLQGRSGEHFSSPNRQGFGAANEQISGFYLYYQDYQMIIRDYSANKDYDIVDCPEGIPLNVVKGQKNPPDEGGLFHVEM